MKILIIYYSRTGITKRVALGMSKQLKADVEEIIDKKNRAGTLGYLSGGRDATLKKLTEIEETKKDPSKYDLVLVGTPVWAYTMAPAIRTYLSKQKSKIKKTAFFCTMGGSGDSKTFKEMEKICSKKPVALLSLLTKEVAEDNYSEKVKGFIKEIRS